MRTQENSKQKWLNQVSPKPELIAWIEDRLKLDSRLGINIGLEEGLILKTLCSLPNVEKVVEIGTQYGCSAAWMAMGLNTKGKILTFEKDPKCIEQAQVTFSDPRFLQLGCDVELITGDAKENLLKISHQAPFDLIFIDANKAAYRDYVDWAKQHISLGGMIVVDNIYLWGTIWLDECPENTPQKMWKNVKACVDDLFLDSQYATSIIPTDEGLLLSCKKSAAIK